MNSELEKHMDTNEEKLLAPTHRRLERFYSGRNAWEPREVVFFTVKKCASFKKRPFRPYGGFNRSDQVCENKWKKRQKSDKRVTRSDKSNGEKNFNQGEHLPHRPLSRRCAAFFWTFSDKIRDGHHDRAIFGPEGKCDTFWALQPGKVFGHIGNERHTNERQDLARFSYPVQYPIPTKFD
eukprot:SAG11_NODE_5249_length_1616_cov_3.388926_1_plen_180_part_00